MNIFIVGGGTSLFISTFSTGAGQARVFQGDRLYVYGVLGDLLSSADSGLTWTNVMPSGQSIVTAITQVSQSAVSLLTTTVAFCPTGKYEASSGGSANWISTGALPSQFSPSDAISDWVSESQVILVGNQRNDANSRIVKSSDNAPYTFLDSDTGVPQSPTTPVALITDLEIAN